MSVPFGFRFACTVLFGEACSSQIGSLGPSGHACQVQRPIAMHPCKAGIVEVDEAAVASASPALPQTVEYSARFARNFQRKLLRCLMIITEIIYAAELQRSALSLACPRHVQSISAVRSGLIWADQSAYFSSFTNGAGCYTLQPCIRLSPSTFVISVSNSMPRSRPIFLDSYVASRSDQRMGARTEPGSGGRYGYTATAAKLMPPEDRISNSLWPCSCPCSAPPS